MASGLYSSVPKHVEMAIMEDRLQREKASRPRVAVVITRVAASRLDPGNMDPKALVDCLRDSRLIDDDNEKSILLEVRQVKARNRKEQGTLIEITYS